MQIKRKITLIVAIPFAISVLVACVSSKDRCVTTTTFNKVNRGQLYAETLFNDLKEKYYMRFTNLDKYTYDVFVYQKWDIVKDHDGASYYDFCVTVYKNDSLYYWGLLDDLKKEDNAQIQKIGEMVSDTLIEKE